MNSARAEPNLEYRMMNGRYLCCDFFKLHLVMAVMFVVAAFVGALAAGAPDALAGIRVDAATGFLKLASFFQEHLDGDACNGETY